jgi:hypothetical protein
MTPDLLTEFAGIQTEVETANIPETSRKTALWCFRQLPQLYEKLAATADNRYAAEIVRLARGALQAIADAPAPEVARVITSRLHALHARGGLPEVKPLAPPKRTARRTG